MYIVADQIVVHLVRLSYPIISQSLGFRSVRENPLQMNVAAGENITYPIAKRLLI